MTITPEQISDLETRYIARTQHLKTAIENNEGMARALDTITKAETLEEAKRIAQEAFDKWR
jgi:hypothetical protein